MDIGGRIVLKGRKKLVLLISVIFISAIAIYFLLLQNLIFGFMVEKKLEIIMSSPGFSSISQDYVNEHKKEYNDIVNMGDRALNYMLKQFEEKDEYG